MGEKRYIISDASKLIDVESHVLRYWEEELDIEIPRNEMGHRYYTEYYIDLFKKIKELKDSGFQLKAIKMVLSDLMNENEEKIYTKTKENICTKTITNISSVHEKNKDNLSLNINDKMVYFKKVMGEIVSDAVRENNQTIFDAMHENSRDMSETVIKQMDYLLRLKEEQEEERFKKFDEIMRNYQRSQKETAAGKDKKRKRRWKSNI